MSHDNGSGPHCPDCRGPLISYSSLRYRECADCREKFAWELKPGQPPLVSNNRMTARSQQ